MRQKMTLSCPGGPPRPQGGRWRALRCLGPLVVPGLTPPLAGDPGGRGGPPRAVAVSVRRTAAARRTDLLRSGLRRRLPGLCG